MISIQKSGDTINFTFTDSSHYLYGNGTISVPENSLSLTIDESDIVNFKKADSNDIFISATLGEFGKTKAELIQFYKENMVNAGISSGDVETRLSEKVDTSAITSAVTSGSTDAEIPTAKAVYDAIPQGGGGKAIEAGRGITITTGETADTVSFNLGIGYLTGNTQSLALNGWVYGTGSTSNSNTESGKVYGAVFLGGYNKNDGHSNGANETENIFIGSSNQIKNTYTSSLDYILGNNVVIGQWNNITGDRLQNSIAIGYYNSGTTSYQLTCGYYNKTSNTRETSFGSFNNSTSASTTFGDSGNTLFSIGNGTANNARHNAFEVRQNGDIYCSDGTNDVKLQDTITATTANTTALGGLSLVKLTQAQYDALSPNYDANTLYVITNVVN